jgi:hypothetical protein
MATAFNIVSLPGGDVTALAADLDAMVRMQRGWVTLQPAVPVEVAPAPPSAFGRLLTGSGPPVPVCTWVAPDAKQKPPHIEIGVQHATGPKATKRLAERGVAVPERWVVLDDHPKRGLVLALPPDVPPLEGARWLVAAGGALTRIPLTGEWRAEVHGTS